MTMTKKDLRKLISAKKRELSEEQIDSYSRELTDKLLSHPAYQKCRTLYAYLSYNQEVRTDMIIQEALNSGRVVAVPRVEGDQMTFRRLNSLSDTLPGFHGIPEPREDAEIICDKEALVLMPGLAFDREGHRLGYGGGFYDRFLEEEPHPTIALCYGFQIVDEVPCEEYDLPVDYVIANRTFSV